MIWGFARAGIGFPVRVLPIILLLYYINVSAKCSEGEVGESSSNKVVSAKIADHVGFCSHHASRDLLHQELCRKAENPKDCFLPAVVDFLEMDAQNLNLKSYSPHGDQALVNILRRETIAAEDCLSLGELFPDTPKAKEAANYNTKFRAVTEATFYQECLREGQSEEKCRRREHRDEDGWKILYASVTRYKSEKNVPRLLFQLFS